MLIIIHSPGTSHIVPVFVGDAALAKEASDKLLNEHDIYVQSINYPTVARGEERLRITVTPRHTLEQIDVLIKAVDQIFTELKINRLADWKTLGGRAGVGAPGAEDHLEPIWNDEQLGYLNGTTPTTLREKEPAVVDVKGVAAARSRFDYLLGPMSGPLQAHRPVVSANMLKLKTGGTKPLVMSAEENVPVVPVPTLVSASA